MSDCSAFHSLLFVVNQAKPHACELAMDLQKIARDSGVSCQVGDPFSLSPELVGNFDACCVIGGDGTLLGVAPHAALAKVPIIGVNRGTLGFLTTFGAEEIRALFPDLLRGHYSLGIRSLLGCFVGGSEAGLALNDIVLKEKDHTRLVHLEVRANNELVTDYYCDGLIISTPTGSTAYNLSSGGPLLHPEASVLALTPICPHTLSNRSMIFPSGVVFRMTNCQPGSSIHVALDGQRQFIDVENEVIEVSQSSHTVQLVQRRDYDHFEVLRTKLHWSGGHRRRPQQA